MVQPLQVSGSTIKSENAHILTEKSSQETTFGVLKEERNLGQRSGTISSTLASNFEHNEFRDSHNADSEITSILQATNLKDDCYMLHDKSKDSSSLGITEMDSRIYGSSADNITKTNGISLEGSQITIGNYKDNSNATPATQPHIKITSRIQSTHESKSSKHTAIKSRMHSSRSCRSELDLDSIGETNRERLLQAFLPDIRRVHARMSYEHRTRPFNLNHEGLKNVQIRAKTFAGDQRFLREHRDETLGRGRKAASNITPRPAWVVKDVPVNAVHEKLFPGEGPTMYAYVKRQQWDYMDRRPGMKRVLPKRTHTK